jgi:hypothetical protein
MPLQLPPGYFVRELPGHGFRPEGPGGVPVAAPQPTHYGALGLCVQDWDAQLALGAQPYPKAMPPPSDGSEALPPGVFAIGRVPFTTLTPSPRPGAVYSPQVSAAAAIAGDAEATGDAEPAGG